MFNTTVDCIKTWPPSYLSLLTTVIVAVFCLVITVGNVMIITAVVIDPLKKLRTPFNYFVVNLAVADLIIGIVCMPAAIYFHIREFLRKKAGFILMRNISGMTLLISLIASLFCLIALSVDRYIAIKFAMKYRSNLTYRKCWIGSFVIWVLSFSLPFIILETGYTEFLIIYMNTTAVIAGIILTTVCIHITKFLQAQTQQMKRITTTKTSESKFFEVRRTSQQKRVTRVFLWILILFLVCYIPAVIIAYILRFCKTCNCEFTHILRDFNIHLLLLNSCMNPFVHASKNKHYRRTFGELWTRCRKKLSMLWSLITSRNNVTSPTEENIEMENR